MIGLLNNQGGNIESKTSEMRLFTPLMIIVIIKRNHSPIDEEFRIGAMLVGATITLISRMMTQVTNRCLKVVVWFSSASLTLSTTFIFLLL